MRIPDSDELFCTITSYGHFAEEAQWNGIRQAFEDLERRLSAIGDSWGDLGRHITHRLQFRSGIVGLLFVNLKPRHKSENLLPKECPRILKTINDIFFVFKDKPREIRFHVDRNWVNLAVFSLTFTRPSNRWPQDVPWQIETPDSDPSMMVILYGRDFDQSIVFHQQFQRAFAGARRMLPDVLPKSGGSYVSDILRVDIEPLPDTELLISRERMRYILYQLYQKLFVGMSLEIRDFGVWVDVAGYPGAKVLFTIIDDRERIDEE
ncbi:MAG: hypothetical protein L6R38_007849 [Xanthoria sp. 2 TBL-2021]|nr:MAG: hypothetical protein L6R38_007849 [Xanthoria sp. 2 TBL-2021]